MIEIIVPPIVIPIQVRIGGGTSQHTDHKASCLASRRERFVRFMGFAGFFFFFGGGDPGKRANRRN